MLAGTSGIRRLDDEWVDTLPVKIGGRVAAEPSEVLERVKARRLDRSSQFAMVAADQAWADAGLEGSGLEGERLAVALASGIGGVTTLLDNYDTLLEKGARRVSPLAVPMLMPNAPAATYSLNYGARAARHSPTKACATRNEAIAMAIDMIRLGRADVVIAGGTEAAIHPLPMAAFANMMALSKTGSEDGGDPTTVSRPWDTGRDGFVLGEGAAVIVLEEYEAARARGATIYAEIGGVGMSSDSHHIAAPEPEGAGASRAMVEAVERAGLTPRDIVHVNAHATSTPVGDVAESNAIRRAFGDDTDGMPVSATKSMTGHLLGAAGALEGVLTILAVHHRIAPATINLDDFDPAIQLDVVHGEARKLPGGDIAALNNSFGFGGHNVAVVFTSV
jgi:3-oxoacyl-[acyl-carrier-protein] synthase II